MSSSVHTRCSSFSPSHVAFSPWSSPRANIVGDTLLAYPIMLFMHADASQANAADADDMLANDRHGYDGHAKRLIGRVGVTSA